MHTCTCFIHLTQFFYFEPRREIYCFHMFMVYFSGWSDKYLLQCS
uniref:Uncharacterized protein n=1 Tax=Rhizophora mucronata TaxID=61149 RepID=A0A2P2MYS3_RHIMU